MKIIFNKFYKIIWMTYNTKVTRYNKIQTSLKRMRICFSLIAYHSLKCIFYSILISLLVSENIYIANIFFFYSYYFISTKTLLFFARISRCYSYHSEIGFDFYGLHLNLNRESIETFICLIFSIYHNFYYLEKT